MRAPLNGSSNASTLGQLQKCKLSNGSIIAHTLALNGSIMLERLH